MTEKCYVQIAIEIHENFQRKAKNFIYSTYHIDK